jgi:SAM-dependent methyltransferase
MNLRDGWRALGRRVANALRRRRMLWAQRRMSDAEGLRDLAARYETPDPWNMAGDKEQYRFAETNRLIVDQVIAPARKLRTILEIGCGEGHQSEHLARLCDQLTGIDVVAAAVARARGRVPRAELIVGELEAQPWADERGRFDLVTAFEVACFFRDLPSLFRTMSRLGRVCMITYHRPGEPLIEPALRALPLAGRAAFSFGATEWRAAWWRPPHQPGT